ncbi:MAG: T9SS type A sorting domain-containing protein [Elusimicrobia bacterium]|nr:T9SS type A sorting domain-containing protein [Elusimicrobiota bacterium]
MTAKLNKPRFFTPHGRRMFTRRYPLFACRLSFVTLLSFAAITNAHALISYGSGYELLSSAINSGGQYLSANNYEARGAAGQNIASSPSDISKNAGFANRSGFYNPPYFMYQKNMPVNFENSSIKLNVPPNYVDKNVFDIFLNDDANKSSKKEKVEEANSKIQIRKGNLAYPLIFNELYFMDEENFYKGDFKHKGEISFKVQDANGDGNVDGTNPPVRFSTLRGYVLDEDTSMWLKTFNNELNANQTYIKFAFTRPSIYAVIGQIDDIVKDVFAYPVPFRPNGPNAGNSAGQTGTEAEGITFANIPQTGSIEIYTIDGRLVRKIEIPLNLVVSKIKWDVKNASGEKAVSGVYIWRIISNGNSKTGKLVIIR